MASNSDYLTYGAVVTYKYGWTNFYGVLRADDSAVRTLEEALKIAEGSSDDPLLASSGFRWVWRWCPGTPARTASEGLSC